MIDQVSQEIEEEVPEQEIIQEAPSIRESLASALEQTKEKQAIADGSEKPLKEIKTGRQRDEEGKFAPKKEAKIGEKTSISPQNTEEIKVPKNLATSLSQEWPKLSPVVQKEIARREEEFHRELTKHDEERNFGRQVDKIITPYMAQIKSEGATAPQAIESLLNMAHLLRVGSPQQKSELLLRTAQTFDVDLKQALQQVRQPENPMISSLQQELQALKSKFSEQENLKKQQEDESIQEQIVAFRADPKHSHFETVKAHMASLLKSGLAKDLQDAYDQAVYANPQTRSTLLQEQNAQTEEKRLADKKAKAEQARKAGSSIKGAPGIAALKNGKIVQPDLRSELRASFAAHREG